MKREVNVAPLAYPVIRFRCPCGGMLELSLEMMANNRPAICNRCDTKLRVEQKSSAAAVAAMVKVIGKLAKVRNDIS